ncbi:hypothetical protein JYU34_000381 [Plutella xylostella]|uniref:Uncharacterized protein n=1 Tax=Plutella xylostella TaxID=51655 RepID=A0ABQ7R7J8_PLUXY|nr:hypothetical protein JYU34_000381 [Plutella xylostella]
MIRTSASQFEVIVDFMERHGDLNKPADGPHGRLTAINKCPYLVQNLLRPILHMWGAQDTLSLDEAQDALSSDEAQYLLPH